MATIYFDESGNTGSNYLDPEQPVYVLSSLKLTEEEATSKLTEHFAAITASDLKFNRLAQYPAGRQAIVSFLAEQLPDSDAYRSYVVLKHYALTAKYVDWIIEPAAYNDGLDLYENGTAAAMASLIWYCAPHAYGDPTWKSILSRFEAWATGRGGTTDELRAHVLKLQPHARFERLDKLIKIAFVGNRHVECPAGAGYKMDLAFTAAYTSVRAWMDLGEHDIQVVHDRTNVMESQVALWRELADPSLNARFFSETPGDWPPLSVSNVRFSDHLSDPALQLADILAGSNRLTATGLLSPCGPFARQLIEQFDLPKSNAGAIWPTASMDTSRPS